MTTHDILTHDWKTLRAKLKERWHSLDDADVEYINGDYEKLVERLQERYLYNRATAERDVNAYLNGMEMVR